MAFAGHLERDSGKVLEAFHFGEFWGSRPRPTGMASFRAFPGMVKPFFLIFSVIVVVSFYRPCFIAHGRVRTQKSKM